jgi:hypothetical protein
MPRTAYALLGSPDHTAVIVSVDNRTLPVRDGSSLSPEQLGLLEVVEQSQGQAPQQRTYDLASMSEGEVWIYRPIGLEEYVGVPGGQLSPQWLANALVVPS